MSTTRTPDALARHTSHAAVGLLAGWIFKSGAKDATILATVAVATLTAILHEALDAPAAALFSDLGI